MKCYHCGEKLQTKRTIDNNLNGSPLARLFRESTTRERFCGSCDKKITTIEIEKEDAEKAFLALETEVRKLKGVIESKDQEIRKIADAVSFLTSIPTASSQKQR